MEYANISSGENVPTIQSLTLRAQELIQAVYWWNTAMIWALVVAALAAVLVVITAKIVLVRTKQLAETQGQISGIQEARALETRLELARITAPVYTIAIVNNIATPDLSHGFTQRVVLTADTHIATPILPHKPEGAAIAWTLFLDQDSLGGHNCKIDFVLPTTPICGLMHDTRTSWEFVTDATGRTTLRGLGTINMPIQ